MLLFVLCVTIVVLVDFSLWVLADTKSSHSGVISHVVVLVCSRYAEFGILDHLQTKRILVEYRIDEAEDNLLHLSPILGEVAVFFAGSAGQGRDLSVLIVVEVDMSVFCYI